MNMLGAPKYTVNTQRREQERVARKKERRIRRWEHWEQRDEEYRLHEQQGLSPPAASEYSLSSEEEGVMGGGLPPRSGILRPPHRELQVPQRSRRPWWARKHPPLGGPWKERRAPWKHRRVPQRHLGVLRRRRQAPNPRGR
jgi:hypothetical protein